MLCPMLMWVKHWHGAIGGCVEHIGGKIGGGGGHCNKHIQLYVVAQKGYQFELCCTTYAYATQFRTCTYVLMYYMS